MGCLGSSHVLGGRSYDKDEEEQESHNSNASDNRCLGPYVQKFVLFRGKALNRLITSNP